MNTIDFMYAQFKAHGYRVTPQRRAILQVLDAERCHPTAEQIYAQVQLAMPDMSPATVYNTVRIDLGTGERHYDVCTLPHAHLLCVQCGRIEDVFLDSYATLSPEQSQGFQVLDTRITFRGYCPDCALSN